MPYFKLPDDLEKRDVAERFTPKCVSFEDEQQIAVWDTNERLGPSLVLRIKFLELSLLIYRTAMRKRSPSSLRRMSFPSLVVG